MKFTKLVKLLAGTALVLGGLAVGTGVSATTTTAQAKTKSTKVVKATYKKISKKAYHVTKGTFYSTSKLTKANHYAKNYKHTTFYTYNQATVTRANGKKAVYYYVKASNNKVKGWIWHSYLKKGVAPAAKKTTTTTTSNKTTTTTPSTTTTTTTPQAPITSLVGSGSTTNATEEQVQVQIFGPQEEGNKILKSGTVDIQSGDTAFDVLEKLDSDISYTGSGSTIYVNRIGSYTAGTSGNGGGWLYNINGSYPSRSAGASPVKNGDLVQWVWTSKPGDRGWTGDQTGA